MTLQQRIEKLERRLRYMRDNNRNAVVTGLCQEALDVLREMQARPE